MNKINLLPPELQFKPELQAMLLVKRGAFVLGILLVMLLVGFGQYRLVALERQIGQLEEQRQIYMPHYEQKLRLEQELEKLEENWVEIKEQLPPKANVGELVGQIAEAIPEDLWLTEIYLSANNVNPMEEEQVSAESKKLELLLEGHSQSVSSVSLLVYYLNHLPRVQTAYIDYSEEVVYDNIFSVVEFRIKGSISY